MNKKSKILIVGHNDVIEQSLFTHFRVKGFSDVISSSEIAFNTTIQSSVDSFFQKYRPEYIFLGSVASGGIQANLDRPADFSYLNLASQNHIIYAAHKFGAKKLLYLASSCVYPKECAQPMKEESILTGALEPSSEPYALAKLAGIKLCQSFRRQHKFNAIVAIPATVYGPESDMDKNNAHVIGALMGKFAQAARDGQSTVDVWGTGNPRREFLHEDDFVKAASFLMDKYESDEVINIGSGHDVTIKELASLVAKTVGFNGEIIFDTTKPDGVMQKLLDNTKINKLGFRCAVSLDNGIKTMLKREEAHT